MSMQTSNININDVLPNELLIYIFKLLPSRDLITCNAVCRKWHALIQDPAVWRNIIFIINESAYKNLRYDKGCFLIEPHRLAIVVSLYKDKIRCMKLQCVNSFKTIEFVNILCQNIISLELVMCHIQNEFVFLVHRWQKLKKLILRNCYTGPKKFDYVFRFDTFRQLKYLLLSDFGLSSKNCHTLLQCKYLSHILIEKIKDLDLSFIRELVLSRQYILETLHIYGGNAINNDSLKLISKCPRLTDLAIIRCENLGNEAFLTLANIKNIKNLQIWNNSAFTEKTILKTLGSETMMKIQRLSLSRIHNVTPAVIDLLSEYYKNLKFLALYQCPKIISTDFEKVLKWKFRNIDIFLY